MKLILAYIPPDHLNRVIDELSEHHVPGLTVSEAKGFGQEHDPAHPEHREFIGLEMTRKMRLEIACQDEEVATILNAIYQATHTGRRGAGKVFVLPVEDVLRLKTGERGPAALGPGPGQQS
jgi:nitrogen regulatory protein PII